MGCLIDKSDLQDLNLRILCNLVNTLFTERVRQVQEKLEEFIEALNKEK